MTFDNLIDLKPNVRVCDLIQLFLLGMDDKIYLTLYNSKGDCLVYDKRIIDNAFVQYYESIILYIEEACFDSHSILNVIIQN